VLVIEKVTEDDNWLVATNAKGKRGMVPANYVVRWNRKGYDRERGRERRSRVCMSARERGERERGERALRAKNTTSG